MRLPLDESRSSAFLRGAFMVPIVLLASCTLRPTKQAAAPPPPTPAAIQPAAPEQPLSIPQTAVTLPGYQEVNPDAIPKVTAPAPAPEKAEAPPAPRIARRSAAVPPKPDPEPEPEATPPPAVPDQAAIQPILNGDEQKKLQESIDGRRRQIDERLKGHASSRDPALVERIKSFLRQCSEAEQRGDYAQADALSERALILAKELPGE
jgi:hypothetical protein